MKFKKHDNYHSEVPSNVSRLIKIIIVVFIISLEVCLLLFSFEKDKIEIKNHLERRTEKNISYVEIKNDTVLDTSSSESSNSIVMKDAIKCVGSNLSSQLYMVKSFEDRKMHSKWINDKIRQIIPKRMDQHCWSEFCGPWIEDIWNEMEGEDFHIFGPFIPLFVPWSKLLMSSQSLYIRWRNKIIELMQKEYFYITISSSTVGIEGQNEKKDIFPSNLLIISSGGKGHIPILMFMRELNPNDYSIKEKYQYDLMFIGTSKYKFRRFIIGNYSKMLGDKFEYIDKYTNWKSQYDQAKFICAPRGLGRSSYRLTEVLQTGRVPVYIYNDIIWLPYYDSINWSSFSIITDISHINKTIDRIKSTSVTEITRMRNQIKSLYKTHFSINGTMDQIKTFLLYGFSKSDLRCAKRSYVSGLSI